MLNPIFSKVGPGEKHPGRWEIAERQIPSIKMLFETNTKGHKHPSIRLFIIEQDTIGKPMKTKSGIQPRNHALPPPPPPPTHPPPPPPPPPHPHPTPPTPQRHHDPPPKKKNK